MTVETKSITMKKLIIDGEKDDGQFKEGIAVIYVNENKQVVIESDDPQVKADLEKEILPRKGFSVRTPGPPEREKEDKEKGRHSVWVMPQKPGDSLFLEGIQEWTVFHTVDRRFGGYKIFAKLPREFSDEVKAENPKK